MIRKIPGIYYHTLSNGVNLDVALIQYANMYTTLFNRNKFRLEISYYQISSNDMGLAIPPLAFVSNHNTSIYDITGSEEEILSMIKDIKDKQKKLDKIAEYLRNLE